MCVEASMCVMSTLKGEGTNELVEGTITITWICSRPEYGYLIFSHNIMIFDNTIELWII